MKMNSDCGRMACNMDNNNGGCVPQETVIENVTLAHAYVPFQNMCETFEPVGALCQGTIFPEMTGMYTYGLKGACLLDD